MFENFLISLHFTFLSEKFINSLFKLSNAFVISLGLNGKVRIKVIEFLSEMSVDNKKYCKITPEQGGVCFLIDFLLLIKI